jgi:hypothetical protein
MKKTDVKASGKVKKTEAKTVEKAKKTTKAAKTVKGTSAAKGTAVKSRKVKGVKPEPTIEEISMKAYEIYNQRISRGEEGTQTDDWHKAVELLKKV